jgi:mycothiol synthase
MIELRVAETDAEIRACLEVRRVVYPNESAGTLEQERARAGPERRLILASLDGELAGYGYVDRSDLPDRFSVSPRVLPGARRREVGTALLHALAEHAVGCGATKLQAQVQDGGSQAFAERCGFRESDREVEQVKTLGREVAPPLPAGLELVTLAQRPELSRESYPLGCEAMADMATEVTAAIPLEHWLRETPTVPEGSLYALAGGEIVAFTELLRHDRPGVAEDGLTAVHRDWRRRGLALTLKQMKLAWAADNGFHEVVTWTQTGNEAMRRVNERLGYEYRTVSVTMVAPAPLPL